MSVDISLTSLEQELIDAIRMKRRDRVEECLSKGVGVNFIAGNFEERPLHIAAEVNAVAIIELLVGKGARLDARDQQGQTPLFHAAEHDAQDAAIALLKLKCDPNHVAHTGRTAIFSAARLGHAAMITLLTDGGADPNFEAQGSAPLFFAVNGSHYEAVKALVKGGARVDQRNRDGLTAGQVVANRNSDFHRDVLTAQFLNAAHLSLQVTKGTEKETIPMKPITFKARV